MMKKNLVLLCFGVLVFWCVSCVQVFAEEEKDVLLCLSPVTSGFFSDAKAGQDSDAKNMLIAVGNIDVHSFAVDDLNNVMLLDANGKKIPLIINKNSIYSEFDDETINAVKVKFFIHDDVYDLGTPKLVWGNEVAANNVLVDRLEIYEGSKDKYRVFNWVEPSYDDEKLNYSATVEVVVDDHANKYYLWYLLPIVLVFGLVIIRKFFRK